ncbi:hypothetical protein IPJ91_00315 [bacterium]|nr:MAG: hypothetical protein IPJ91_00315 [bacterium]
MFIQYTIFFTLSLLISILLSKLIIQLLIKFDITRRSSRNINATEKDGKPIMGGLIFIIPTVIVSLFANYILPEGRFVYDSSIGILQNVSNFFGAGVIKIPILVFLLAAILGGVDDLLNLFGTDRAILKLSRVLKLITVHKSIFERVKLAILFPWHAYKNFFFILGSNPGKGVQAHEKILVQVVIGTIIAWWIYGYMGISGVTIPFLGAISLGLLMYPFTILTVMTMANAVNITDGVDGLSSGLSIITLTGFFIVAIVKRNSPIAVLISILLGGLVVYFYYNKKPAKVEMGDTGSLALGVIITAIALALNQAFLLVPFCLMFLIEFASSFIQGLGRRFLGRRIFKMAPLHHHFEMLGWREERIVRAFLFVGVLGVFLGLIWVI